MRVSIKPSQLSFQSEDVLRTLAGRIKTARLTLGLTQPDLATKAGISTNTLLKMEKGSASVQIGYWLQLLWALDLLDGFEEALTRLGRTDAMASLLEDKLPKRVSGKRLMGTPKSKGST